MLGTRHFGLRHVGVSALVVIVMLALITPTSAVETEAEPELLPHRRIEETYSLGEDRLGVFRCKGADDKPAKFYADELTRLTGGWYDHHSRGRYTPVFLPRKQVLASDFPLCTGNAYADPPKAWSDRYPNLDGAIVVGPQNYQSARQSYLCREDGRTVACPGLNDGMRARYLLLNSDFVEPGESDYCRFLGAITAIHEMGHTLNWPHTYTGTALREPDFLGPVPYEYDTYGDLMSSGGGSTSADRCYNQPPVAATNVFNLLRSGWIKRNEVWVVDGSGRTINLYPNHTSGGQWRMVVLPSAENNTYFALGARRRGAYDHIPTAWGGVEVFTVKGGLRWIEGRETPQQFFGQHPIPFGERPTSCLSGFDPETGCAQPSDWPENVSLPHVIRPGKGLHVGKYTVVVTEDDGNHYEVEITRGKDPLPPGSLFADTNDTVFSDEITWLAESEITLGCNPPFNFRFCPAEAVTRAEMASFLTRALRLLKANADQFTDVGSGNPHSRDIGALARAEITLGCNPPKNSRFCPDEAVSRAEMASFLTRALDLPKANAGQFTDVGSGNPHARDIAALARAKITLGCNPPANNRFCPDESVTREQMAGFLSRALR